jgi:hypothetical protein
MNKKIRIIVSSTFLVCMVSCGFDVADRTKTTQVSETIEDSKAKGVFLAEYKPNREIIKKAWAEMPWMYDTLGNIDIQKNRYLLYIEANDSIGLTRTLQECIQGETYNGHMGFAERAYLVMNLTEELLSKDTLKYYMHGANGKKCMGELQLVKKK